VKTVQQDDEPLSHLVGAMNDEAVPGIVSLRTYCGLYLHCEPRELSNERHTTCVRCASEVPDWLSVGRALGAQTIDWKGSSARIDLKIL
jgi:hypothetical protein